MTIPISLSKAIDLAIEGQIVKRNIRYFDAIYYFKNISVFDTTLYFSSPVHNASITFIRKNGILLKVKYRHYKDGWIEQYMYHKNWSKKQKKDAIYSWGLLD